MSELRLVPSFEALGKAAADIANLKIVLPVYTTPIAPPAPAPPSTDQGSYKFCVYRPISFITKIRFKDINAVCSLALVQ